MTHTTQEDPAVLWVFVPLIDVTAALFMGLNPQRRLGMKEDKPVVFWSNLAQARAWGLAASRDLVLTLLEVKTAGLSIRRRDDSGIYQIYTPRISPSHLTVKQWTATKMAPPSRSRDLGFATRGLG